MSNRVRSLLLACGRVLLFATLLVLPSVVRAGTYYRGAYGAVEVPRPDLTSVEVSGSERGVFVDADVGVGKGQVLIDRAHDNVVDDAELNVLLSRLTTRGMSTVSLMPDDALPDALRTATAMVVVSPHQPFSVPEIKAVERFVQQGGRVLLAADPSRYAFELRDDAIYGEISVAESDVAAINSLASVFGLAFADDYLYNTSENAGNYQYVLMRDFAESPVTAGLEEVVFYAAHSLISSQESLILADEATTSSLSEQRGGLATMGLGGGGQVLAVGDFTFMSEPYNAVSDNDRLIANMASFIAGASRTFGLAEYPHFFGDDIDLVPVTFRTDGYSFSVAAVEEVSSLQSAVESAGKTLHWRGDPDVAHDTFYLGLYGGIAFWPEVGELLEGHGITFTLETAERQRAALTPTATPRYTPTPVSEATLFVTPTLTPTPRPLRDWIHFPGIGPVDAKEAALFYQNDRGGRQVLVVLAFGEAGLRAAADRLLLGDFGGCLIDDDREGDPDAISLALCPTAYEVSGERGAPTPTPALEDGDGPAAPETLGSVLIVSDDEGEGMYEWWNSAYQFHDIVLSAGYEPLIWSTDYDGDVTLEQLQSYDAVLWCTGDYQDEGGNPSVEEFELLGEYMGDGGNVLLIGAFLGEPEERESGLLLDIQVAQSDHPLAEGFSPGQVISLERFTAEEDYAPYVMVDVDANVAIWTRGPESAFAGEPIIAVMEDEFLGGRLMLSGVPLYLLPQDDADRLGTQMLLWLVGAG